MDEDGPTKGVVTELIEHNGERASAMSARDHAAVIGSTGGKAPEREAAEVMTADKAVVGVMVDTYGDPDIA